jgi:hypothetical protein
MAEIDRYIPKYGTLPRVIEKNKTYIIQTPAGSAQIQIVSLTPETVTYIDLKTKAHKSISKPKFQSFLDTGKVSVLAVVVEAGWKESLLGVIMTLGLASPSFANTASFHKALENLNSLGGPVPIKVVQNSNSFVNIKVGDYSIKGRAVGGGGFSHLDLGIYGPKDGGTGYEQAKVILDILMSKGGAELAK